MLYYLLVAPHHLSNCKENGWESPLEEGRIDARRLARLVTSPAERALFRDERVAPRADALVTLLIDCSGSMKSRAEAVAVLDPKRPDCPYPLKELSGCGIGFKLMQGFAQRNGIEFEELESLLDLVAISTACDIVPVGGETRILCYFGLQRINDKPRPGVRAILGMANVKKRLGVSDLVFSIGPRINAAGRIEHGRKAVELLLAHEEQQAVAIATLIDGNNSHRQELDRNMTEEALAHIAEDEWQQSAWSTVVFNPDWHKGVVGIVASRLTERHYKPTVVLTASNGKAVGSARSVKGFDVYEAISVCSDLLEQFAGHMYAAGPTMPLENVEAFRARLKKPNGDTHSF